MATNRTTRTTLTLLALAIVAVFGCSLSPDAGGDSGVTLRVQVAFEEEAKSAGRSDLFEDVADLSAMARVYRVPAAAADVHDDICDAAVDSLLQLAGGGELAVAVDEEDEALVLEGDLDFELGSPGARYRLTIELAQRGRRIDGLYAGTIVLDSGLDAEIDTLRLHDLDPTDLTIDELSLCLYSSIIEDLDDEDRCLSGLEIEGTWDPDRNELGIGYERDDVELDGIESSDVRVVFQAGLVPAPIYRGCAEIELLTAEVGELDVTILLEETPESGPGLVGERLVGNLNVDMVRSDGTVELGEHGVIDVVRIEPQDMP